MAQAEIQEVVTVDRKKLFEAITRYEDYPQFVEGCKSVKVERKGAGKVRATYQVHVMKDIEYVIDLVENEAAGTVTWTQVSSDFFAVNNGAWHLTDAGGGKTNVKYGVEIEFKIPVPGFILKGLVKGSLPKMVKSFADRARKK